MAIKPHPQKKNTWIIDYSRTDESGKKYQEVEFTGPLKDAIEYERSLSRKGKAQQQA